jgi:DNA polymerase-3 subunit delta
VATVTAAVLRKQLASGEAGPLYVLVGDDEAEKSALAGEFADVVDEGLRAFNVDRFYGGDTKVDTVIDAASTLPMMVPRRVIIVLEAEKLLIPKRESKAADEDQNRLEAFIDAPPRETTVVFVCGSLDLRRRLIKLLLKEAQVVNCGSIESEADADLWVKARAARDKVPLDAAAVRTLIQRAGLDIVRLRAGLERLALYGIGQSTITAEDVRQAVPASSPQSANFGIADAIRSNDAREALRQLSLVLDEGAQPFFVLGQLRFAAEKLPPSRLKAGIEALMRTDIALKSSGGDPRLLLERLVVELCADSARGRPAPTSSRGGYARGTGRR